MRTTDIKTAAIEAQKIGGYITRHELKEYMYIFATNHPECCICYIDGEEPCHGWQPKMADLIADDWEVIQPASKNDGYGEEEEVEGLTQVETIRLTTALLEFIERVTRPGARPEELEAMPMVAEVLSRFR